MLSWDGTRGSGTSVKGFLKTDIFPGCVKAAGFWCIPCAGRNILLLAAPLVRREFITEIFSA